MSRIDEALNRASGRVGKTSELNRHSSGAVPMDKYPTETPQPEALNRASGGAAKTSKLTRHSSRRRANREVPDRNAARLAS